MRRLAVLGSPVAHSRSPAMHSAAIAELGLAGEWSYEAIEVAPHELTARLESMAGEGFAGANVTVPHKVAALRLADDPSEAASEIGAANTLTFTGSRIAADNTDGTGLLGAIGVDPAGSRALVLGAGGAARAVVWALTRAGAAVHIWNRTGERAATLAAELGGTAVAVEEIPALDELDLVVNTTLVGMAEGAGEAGPTLKELPLNADSLGARHLVVDLAYGAAPTELVRAATQRGARVVDGLEVLVHQGAASLRIWTGSEPPIEAMRRAARAPHDTR